MNYANIECVPVFAKYASNRNLLFLKSIYDSSLVCIATIDIPAIKSSYQWNFILSYAY